MFRFVLSSYLFLSCFISSTLFAQNIRDYAQFFSVQTATEAQQKIEQLEAKLGTKNLIVLETYSQIPSGTSLKDFYRSKFPRERNFKGVYILITQKPKKIIIGSSKNLSGALGKRALSESRSLMLNSFKEKKFDQGLEQGLSFLSKELTLAFEKSTPSNKVHVAANPVKAPEKQKSSGFSFSRLVIWGAIILCVLFLISRLFGGRQQSHFPGRSVGDSQPQNPWQGNQSNSGSGILGSVLGGIGGAMAGSWLYDKFFNSNASASSTPPEAPAASPISAPEPKPMDYSSEPDIGDVSGDFSSGDDWGGDFGDSGGSDDW